MTDIELDEMADHDLLVVAVTNIKSMDKKLDTVCATVNQHEKQLTVLETEHNLRIQQADCAVPQAGAGRKTIATSAGVGTFIGAVIVGAIDYLLRR